MSPPASATAYAETLHAALVALWRDGVSVDPGLRPSRSGQLGFTVTPGSAARAGGRTPAELASAVADALRGRPGIGAVRPAGARLEIDVAPELVADALARFAARTQVVPHPTPRPLLVPAADSGVVRHAQLAHARCARELRRAARGQAWAPRGAPDPAAARVAAPSPGASVPRPEGVLSSALGDTARDALDTPAITGVSATSWATRHAADAAAPAGTATLAPAPAPSPAPSPSPAQDPGPAGGNDAPALDRHTARLVVLLVDQPRLHGPGALARPRALLAHLRELADATQNWLDAPQAGGPDRDTVLRGARFGLADALHTLGEVAPDRL